MFCVVHAMCVVGSPTRLPDDGSQCGIRCTAKSDECFRPFGACTHISHLLASGYRRLCVSMSVSRTRWTCHSLETSRAKPGWFCGSPCEPGTPSCRLWFTCSRGSQLTIAEEVPGGAAAPAAPAGPAQGAGPGAAGTAPTAQTGTAGLGATPGAAAAAAIAAGATAAAHAAAGSARATAPGGARATLSGGSCCAVTMGGAPAPAGVGAAPTPGPAAPMPAPAGRATWTAGVGASIGPVICQTSLRGREARHKPATRSAESDFEIRELRDAGVRPPQRARGPHAAARAAHSRAGAGATAGGHLGG